MKKIKNNLVAKWPYLFLKAVCLHVNWILYFSQLTMHSGQTQVKLKGQIVHVNFNGKSKVLLPVLKAFQTCTQMSQIVEFSSGLDHQLNQV